MNEGPFIFEYVQNSSPTFSDSFLLKLILDKDIILQGLLNAFSHKMLRTSTDKSHPDKSRCVFSELQVPLPGILFRVLPPQSLGGPCLPGSRAQR